MLTYLKTRSNHKYKEHKIIDGEKVVGLISVGPVVAWIAF